MDQNIDSKLDSIIERLDLLTVSTVTTDTANEYQSSDTSKLNKALANANSEFPKIVINRQNAYAITGYADLDHIMNKIRPILSKHEIHVSQQKKDVDGKILLVTRVWHSTGQWIESRIYVKAKENVDHYGSLLNKLKRFEIMDILSLTVSEDPFDDDGEMATGRDKEVAEDGTKVKNLYNRKNISMQTISADEYDYLMDLMNTMPDYVQEIQEELEIRSLREMPKSLFAPTVKRINEVKLKRTNMRKRQS